MQKLPLSLCLFYNHGQKSWDTFAFLGRFPIHTGPNPALTPQTMLDACIHNFFQVSTLYRVGGGRSARKFRKWWTVLSGNGEMTEKYAYCSTVPRNFVQDCSSTTTWAILSWRSFILGTWESGWDKVGIEIQGLSSTYCNFQRLSRPWTFYFKFQGLSRTFKVRANPVNSFCHRQNLTLVKSACETT